MVTAAASYLYPSKLGPRMFTAGLTSVILREVFFKEDKVLSFTTAIVIANLLKDLVLFNADELGIQQTSSSDSQAQKGWRGHFFKKTHGVFPSRFAVIAGFCVYILALRTFSGESYRQTLISGTIFLVGHAVVNRIGKHLISGTIFLVGHGFVKGLVDQSGDRIPDEIS
ncbi:MAG: hypothetical protein K940chlam8_00387 [Chlamydiae bacterium]|nr:hypothetical protein [Chlamydiota bacterium]